VRTESSRDRALARLERLLGMPAGREMSVATLRAAPCFGRLLEKFAAR
jgi:hypothetical protein